MPSHWWPLGGGTVRLLIEVVITAAFIALSVVVMVEFLAGCGETYIDAKGKRHANECLVITP